MYFHIFLTTFALVIFILELLYINFYTTGDFFSVIHNYGSCLTNLVKTKAHESSKKLTKAQKIT